MVTTKAMTVAKVRQGCALNCIIRTLSRMSEIRHGVIEKKISVELTDE
jgi:hypothetical protein